VCRLSEKCCNAPKARVKQSTASRFAERAAALAPACRS
jgi:hypothetical protein